MDNLETFRGLTQAIELKASLQDVDNRLRPSFKRGSRTAAGMLGIHGRGRHEALPVYNDNDTLFALDIIKSPEMAVTASGQITEGALLEFEGDQHNSAFGIVVEPPPSAVKRGIYVRNLTKEQVTQIQAQNPHLPKVHVNNSNLKPLVKIYEHTDTRTARLLAITDPMQRFMIRFLKETLRKVGGNSAKLIDTLLWLYLAVLLLALLIMVFVFIN